MAFDFAALKSATRRVVHDTLGVTALYQDDAMSAPVAIKARYLKQKVDRYGDLVEQGYAEVVEGIDRVVLFPCDYQTLNFARGGLLTFPDYKLTFRLELMEPADGPLQSVWQVVKV
jgi:hypothetical protein